jgi:glycosyltransferase involved in cell wall biosynthesis
MTAEANTPLVTIGLPVYNSERYLAQSIESLLAQTFRSFVLVISDNASTDRTADICKHYAAADPRVRYHRNAANIGLSANFNRVFALNQSTSFKWSTADDHWAPAMLADAVEILEADSSIVVCYPRVVIIDSDGKEQGRFEDELNLMQDDPAERFLTLLRKIKLVNHHLGVLRSDAIGRTNLFGKHLAADIGFLAEMSLYGKFREVPKYQFFRRFHLDSSSWQRSNQEQQARRFHAADVRRIPFNSWRFHWALFRAVLHSPLTLGAKTRLIGTLSKRSYWDRNALFGDLRHDLLLVLGFRK